MTRIFSAILWFLILTKTLFFWVWLWQLKEYHLGRFRAHFETQKTKKLISSFYRVKSPKITKKTGIILFFGILLEILMVFYLFAFQEKEFYLSLLILLILSPLIFSLLVLLFQIPTAVLRRRILKKAQQKREKFKDLLIIGITGSYGKTSTKEFLAEILSKKYNVLKTKKHINAEIGIAQTILNELKEKHQIFIAEIGAYERGKIKEVCKILEPKIGILTGISEQHMSTFGSQENIIKAKFELIGSLPQNGLAIFNGNNKYCRELYQKTKIPKKIVYPHTTFKERWCGVYPSMLPGDVAKLTGKNLFPWDIENLAMATIVAEYLGVSKEEIENTLTELESPVKIKKGINGSVIIDSTYSANPKSVISHLNYLKKREGKKVLIMPCLIELGSASEEIHQKIGEEIGKICDLAVITTKDYFKELKESAQKSGMPSENILLVEKSKQIFEKISNFIRPGDIILLESRVPKELLKELSSLRS